MSDKININFTGILFQLPKQHFTPKEFVTFSVAVNHSEKNNIGGFDQITHWFNCISYNPFMIKEILLKLTKGSKVYICGEMRIKELINETGTKTSLNVNITNFKSFDAYPVQETKETLQYEDVVVEEEEKEVKAPPPPRVKVANTPNIIDDEIPF